MSRALPIAAAALVAVLAAILWRSCVVPETRARALVAEPPTSAENPTRDSTEDLEVLAETLPATDRHERTEVDALPRTIVLAGVVLDLLPGEAGPGTPAPGVKVGGHEGFFGGDDLEPVVTDDRGRFRVHFPDPGKRPLRFAIFCDGSEVLRPASAHLTLKEGLHECLGIELRRYPVGDLIGITIDPEDAPVANVKLTFRTGEDTRTTTSDAQGRFHLANAPSFHKLEAECDAYLLLEARRPKQIPSGGWEPMRVVLGPVGRMRILVADKRGVPLSGYTASVHVSRLERFGPKGLDHQYLRPPLQAETGADGTAVLENVWAGCRLTIEVSRRTNGGSTVWLASERAQEGMLLFGGTSGGSPITVRPAEETDLRAVVSAGLRLQGRVEDEAGQPVAEAVIQLVSTSAEAAEDPIRGHARSDAAGRFILEVAAKRPLRSVRLIAANEEEFLLMKETAKVASLDLDLSAGAPPEIVLVLRQGLSIRGRVIDRGGNGVSARVTTYPSPYQAWMQSGDGFIASEARIAIVGKAGTFSVSGLVPGAYDVRVRPNGGRFSETWLREVDAGRDGVEILIERERPVRVIVEVRLREGEPDQIVVLRSQLRPRVASFDAPHLGTATEWTELRGWPESYVGQRSGSSGAGDERGRISHSSDRTKDNPTTLLLDEGYYWLGARGSDKEGNSLFPIGTGLVHLEVGEYRVRFELVAAVPVEGRVRASDVLDLAVGVARAGSELLKLDGGGEQLERFRELGADGYFRFAAVPVGDHELWVGTPAQLEAGTPVHRQAITIERKSEPFFEVVIAR